MASASFSSLPPELVSNICNDPGLKEKDLIALRLTSKAQGIHASATKALGKLCFTAISLLYTEYSLETFTKICDHSIFGPIIRRVELSCTHFDTDAFDSYVKTLADCEYTREELIHQVQRLSARCDAEEFFKVSYARALLDRAFTHLTKSNHSLTIAISTGEYTSIGRSRTFEPDPDSEYFYADVPFALDLLLGSAKQSGCKVTELDIGVAARRFYHDSHYDSYYDLYDLMHSISDVSLELTLIDDYGDEEPQEFILWMRDLLSYGTDIKSLDLCLMVFDDNDERKFEPFFRIIMRLPLEVLRLQDLYMSQKATTDLLESLRSTLRRLTIGCCDVVGSWREILVSIQQNSSRLDYLEIYDGILSWLQQWGSFRGTTAVQSGLEKMLQAEQDVAKGSDDRNDDD
ncbi:hypothetical protein KCU91_g7350, partial [Aureobasidium melanogenum]